jgi:hypothetical protein
MGMIRAFGKSIWWRSQNLNREEYRDDNGRYRERITGHIAKHGRGWLKWGDPEQWPSPEIRAEWKVGKPINLVGGYLQIENDEDPISTGFYLWPFSLYLSADTKLTRWIAKRLVSDSWDGEREIQVVLSAHDKGTFNWSLWHPVHSWSSKTPKWRNGHWCPLDWVLGRWDYSNDVLSTHSVEIPMPERSYPATVSMERSTWRRHRVPFLSKSIKRAKVDIPGGIGYPGKGENAWDCGDDATFGLTAPAYSVEDAIGQVVSSVLRNRMRYGGEHTFTPSEASA